MRPPNEVARNMSNTDFKILVAKSDTREAPSTPDVPSSVKIRTCLMCETKFESEWSGERVCRKCKSTSKWRSG